ncbi:MAG: hypothetical protein ABSH09_21275 [Bryobacteraceae bacterium]|jgi:hypothetical protein
MRRLLILLTLSALALTAADHPNFTGSWKMNAARSDFGEIPKPTQFDRKIDHKDPTIRMSVHQVLNTGERTIQVVLRTDGKETTNASSTGEAKTTCQWNGRELNLITTRQMEGGNVISRETWSLLPDGQTLVSITNMQTPRGIYTIRLVLDKQP